MKFRAERNEFADAAAWALRTVGQRATLPALSGVRLEVRDDHLHLSSYDLEISSELSIAVQAERDGTALVPGRVLGDVVRSLPQAAVSAEVDKDRLRLSCGRAQFDLHLMPNPEDFPELPQVSEDAPVAVMKAEDFASMVAQVARASAAEDGRVPLTGVNLEISQGHFTAAATDSYRLAVRTVPWEEGVEAEALVPRRSLEEARRAVEAVGSEVRLVVEPAQVAFLFDDRRLVTRLIEGKFPDYRKLVPAGYERRLTVDRAELMEVVRRVSVVGEARAGATTPVVLHLTEDAVRVTVNSGEVGQAEESLPGQLEGEALEIGFNPRYLSDGLDATGSERVVFEFRDEFKPAVMRPAVEDTDGPVGDYLYLLMPVRL
jgi:DNA polymerase-3 subunit beta